MRALMTLLGLALTVSLAAQDKPLSQAELAKLPMYERLLKGDDAKKAAELASRIREARAAQDFTALIQSAEEQLSLRLKVQGADHYETISAKMDVDGFKKLAGLSAEKHAAFFAALQDVIQAQSLETQGKYRESYSARKQFVAICKEFYGLDHPETVSSIAFLANNLDMQGKAREGQVLHEQALSRCRKTLGENHPHFTRILSNLSANLNDQGKAAQAQSLIEQCLAINRRILGEQHSDTLAALASLAYNLDAQEKSYQAQPLHEKVIELTRKVYGEEHPELSHRISSLGGNLVAQGKFAQAEPYLLQALAIDRINFGENHPYTAMSLNNLASNLMWQGKEAQSRLLFEQALAISQKINGEYHPQTANCLMNLANCIGRQGRRAEAQSLLEQALAIRRKVHGEQHPETAKSLATLAGNLSFQGQVAEARRFLEQARAIMQQTVGNNSSITAEIIEKLANNYDTQGMVVQAQQLYQDSLEIRRKLQGEDHPDTATTYSKLAWNLIAQRKSREAKVILNHATFSTEASRLNRAKGIERAIGEQFNPRLLLATLDYVDSPVDAWNQVEMTLARGQLDQQQSSSLTLDEQREKSQLLDKLTDLNSQIQAITSKTKRTNDEITELEQLIRNRQDISQKLAILAVADSERSVASPDQINVAIPSGAAVLLWVDLARRGGFEEHFACVVRRNSGPKWARLPGSGEMGKWTEDDTTLPRRFRDAIVTGATTVTLAQQLRKQRIEPVLKHLEGITQLYVVGVNAMAGIPVQVLAPEFTISYVPSGTFLARLPKKPKYENTLLAVGDPIYEVEKAQRIELTALPLHGQLIQGLAPGGAAEKLGLQPGDVLLQYGDSKIEKVDQLRSAIQKAATSGDKTVSVTVWRVGEDNKATEKSLNFPVGPLGVILAEEPAPVAIADRRKTEALFAKLNRGDEWGDLPGTRFEVSQVAKLFPRAKVLLDGNASERGIDALRQSGELGKFRYLHFATHGKANNVTAFESKLILSQDQTKGEIKAGEPWLNNEISAREVLDFWKLNADLVTLSACETGLGKSGSGDGLLGFAQAFLLSGARSVCLSLWEVDDTATALLMQRFYQNLLGQRPGLTAPMSKQLALKEAKEWLRDLTNAQATELTASLMNGVSRGTRGEIQIKNRIKADAPPESKPYANPHYWSAFILIGDPE